MTEFEKRDLKRKNIKVRKKEGILPKERESSDGGNVKSDKNGYRKGGITEPERFQRQKKVIYDGKASVNERKSPSLSDKEKGRVRQSYSFDFSSYSRPEQIYGNTPGKNAKGEHNRPEKGNNTESRVSEKRGRYERKSEKVRKTANRVRKIAADGRKKILTAMNGNRLKSAFKPILLTVLPLLICSVTIITGVTQSAEEKIAEVLGIDIYDKSKEPAFTDESGNDYDIDKMIDKYLECETNP